VTQLYCLDAGVFINSWRKHYPNDVFPCVWHCLDDLTRSGQAIIPFVIYEEIKKGGDDLFSWLEWFKRESVIRPDERHLRACKAIVQAHPKLLETKKNRSGSGADPWVIAYAQIEGAVVVTEEPLSNQIAKPKIPDVCRAMNIEFINTVELLRRCGLLAEHKNTTGGT
jgi:hypothetical protein